MSEEQKILAFNRELDRLLGVESEDGAASGELDEQDRSALRGAAALARVDFNGEINPDAASRRRWQTGGRVAPVRRLALSCAGPGRWRLWQPSLC